MSLLSDIARQLENNKQEALTYLSSDLLLAQFVDAKRADFRLGLGGYGEIEPIYGASYSDFKQSLPSYNLNGKTPDLYVEGNFYNSLQARLLSVGVYEVYSDNSRDYFEGLTAKYGGEELYEITENQLKPVLENISSSVVEILRLE